MGRRFTCCRIQCRCWTSVICAVCINYSTVSVVGWFWNHRELQGHRPRGSIGPGLGRVEGLRILIDVYKGELWEKRFCVGTKDVCGNIGCVCMHRGAQQPDDWYMSFRQRTLTPCWSSRQARVAIFEPSAEPLCCNPVVCPCECMVLPCIPKCLPLGTLYAVWRMIGTPA